MRTPLINVQPRADCVGHMWPAIAVVPWRCWAASPNDVASGYQSQRLRGKGSMPILARHWNILPPLGLPTPPSRDWLRPCLTQPSITAVPMDVADDSEEEEEEQEEEEDEEEEEEDGGRFLD